MNRSALTRILFGIALVPWNALAFTMDFVPVGNPANAADPANSASVPGIGTVNSTFAIGAYEVTNSQYAEFLNSVDLTGANSLGLYSPNMASDARGGINFTVTASIGAKFSIKPGFENMPVVFISFLDAARFTNWLHNGQGSGSTETGAYTLLGGGAFPTNAATVTRESGAQFWIPSENEWYKAAYYQPVGSGGDADSYWLYPMKTNLQPFSDQPPGVTPDNTRVGNFVFSDNIVNGYDDGYAVTGALTFGTANTLTEVGAYTQTTSYYGLYDVGGNVLEWTDTVMGADRGVRGGSWDMSATGQQSSTRTAFDPAGSGNAFGFRVVMVPEPTAIGLALFGALGIAGRRKPRD